MMVKALNNDSVLCLLSSGDVASNELYYHDSCYNKIRNEYNKKNKTEISLKNDEYMYRKIALKKVIFYLKDSEMSAPGSLFYVNELENMYISLLEQNEIIHTKHSTHFSK